MPDGPGRKAVFTIASKNYLPFVRTLMASAKECDPAYRRYLVLADTLADEIDVSRENFEIVLSAELPIPDPEWFHFKYNILELNTAVKPYAISYLMERFGFDRLIYLDPDICLYHPLAEVDALLDCSNVVLTPHLLSPITDSLHPGELTILQAGAYNLGFIAVRAGAESRAFTTWWQQKVRDQAYIAFERGLFTDQRWIDLVPGMFKGVEILRDPGYNVAYWNLKDRPIERRGDRYFAGGSPLVFFHFSGFDPRNPDRFSKYQNRFVLPDLGEAAELVLGYREALLSHGYNELRTLDYAYGRFRNGHKIPDMCRRYGEQVPDPVADPFSDEGFESFATYWNVIEPRPRPLTRLARQIYEQRPDLQARMPDLYGEHYLAFLEWFTTTAAAEHELIDRFIEPLRATLLECRKSVVASRMAQRRETTLAGLPEKVRPLVRIEANRPWTFEALAAWLNESEGAATRLARLIYEDPLRPDLRQAFPEFASGSPVRFLKWLVTTGRIDYGLTATFTDTLEQNLSAYLEQNVGLIERSRVRFVISAHRAVAGAPPAVPVHQVRHLTVQSEAGRRPRVTRRGINLIGYLRSEHGVGELARALAISACESRIPLILIDFESGNQSRQEDRSVGETGNAVTHPINVCVVNADQTERLRSLIDPGVFRGRYNIGFWAWELEEFPEQWRSAFAAYDEIWVMSEFCREAVARKSPVPVVRVPPALRLEAPEGITREWFGLPADGFLFLNLFDTLSVVKRKNPAAVIEAFRRASAELPDAHLVLKINNAALVPEVAADLRRRCSGLPVTILDKIMTRGEVNALMAVSDCVVSLHRSEGFGLTLAEAMYLGKPVIATAYSGNMDFTLPETALLVDYRLVEVGSDAAPYDARARWAEPDVAKAAERMVTVRRDERLRTEVARRGCEFVRRVFHPAETGKRMAARIDQIVSQAAQKGEECG